MTRGVAYSPVAVQVFRQLFCRRSAACEARTQPSIPGRATTGRPVQRHEHHHRHHHHHHHHHQQRCSYATRASRDRGMKTNESRWQQRTNILPEDRRDEFAAYPYVTAEDLKTRRERPRKVKMLLRDFIDDSLYNPHYGYFAKQAVIFSPGDAFDFKALRDDAAFQRELGRRYTAFEDALDDDQPNPTRQLWHTPTELFRPAYGEAVARHLVANYRLTTFPYADLLIYEVGAGRGTLMRNILDHIRAFDPAVYARTRYAVIEISPALARHQAAAAAAAGHRDRVDILNVSVLDWRRRQPSPCFFLAFEVWDNLAHDVIRYDCTVAEDPEPLQGHVLIDAHGDLYEFYVRQLDPLAARFFRVRHAATDGAYPRPYPASPRLRALAARLPFAPNLSRPEYIPTRLMQFFDVLDNYFPAHRLLASDFDALPNAVPGLNAPVVQTRYRRRMVPVTTPLVHQGYFDILFPTDFRVAEAMYQAMTGKLTRVMSHGDFMRRWAYLEDTETRSGENPLLTHYQNASVLVTV